MGNVTGVGLDRLLADFVDTTSGALAAVVVSADGIPMATSPGVTQTIVEMAEGYLFVTAIGLGATLAVHAGRSCDIGSVGYGMTMLADRVGHALTPTARADPLAAR